MPSHVDGESDDDDLSQAVTEEYSSSRRGIVTEVRCSSWRVLQALYTFAVLTEADGCDDCAERKPPVGCSGGL